MSEYKDGKNEDAKRARQKAEQETDQAMTWLAERCPPLWRRIYVNCIAEGFTELQAMELLKSYISKPG